MILKILGSQAISTKCSKFNKWLHRVIQNIVFQSIGSHYIHLIGLLNLTTLSNSRQRNHDQKSDQALLIHPLRLCHSSINSALSARSYNILTVSMFGLTGQLTWRNKYIFESLLKQFHETFEINNKVLKKTNIRELSET